PVAAGSALTYTLLINNFGPDTAVAPVVTDDLPPSVKLANATVQRNSVNNFSMGSCTQSPGASGDTLVRCSLIDMDANTNATITIVVTPALAAVGQLMNTAQVQSNTADPNPANNTSTVQVTVTGGPGGNPPPIISSLSPSSAVSGGP